MLSQHALQVVSQHALQQGGLGDAWSWGVPGPGGGYAPWGVCSQGGVTFCCGLLLWPSVEDSLLLKVAFWYGLRGGGRRPPHQKATTQEGHHNITPLQAHTQGEIEGDQIQAHTQGGN